MAHPPTLGLIGSNGAWGQKILATLQALNIPTITGNSKDWYLPLSHKEVSGVIIASPADTHIDLAYEVLSRGLPVLIEKPLATSFSHILKLYQFQDLPILIDHIHLFSPDFLALAKIVKDKKITKITSLGFGFGPFRNDCSPIFDYCHDFSMSLYLTHETPRIVKVEQLNTSIGQIFDITLKYYGFTHSMVIGNGSEQKARYFEVECEDGTVVSYDAFDPNRLKCNGYPIYDVAQISPLANLIQVFVKAITSGTRDERFGLDLGRRVIKVAENCHKKIARDIAKKRKERDEE